MLLEELLQAVEVLETGGNYALPIKGIAYDSRQVGPGDLFVSIEGFQSDGHFFIAQAIKRGAVAVVMERKLKLASEIAWAVVPDSRRALALLSARFFGNPSDKLTLIGVTGTNGKTTTTSLIADILSAAGQKTGLIGTIHSKIGERIIPSSHTTPESTDLQGLLREMLSDQVGACVMEVSSHALALQRVEGCEFDLALFTNLTREHLDLHGSMEEYLAAKLRLFEGLKKPGVKKAAKLAVVNADDPAAASFLRAAGGSGLTYGLNATADVYATEVHTGVQGVRFKVEGVLGSCVLNLHLAGLFNVYNALAAFCAGVLLGVPLAVVKDALENVSGVPGRFERVYAGQDFTVIVDYAHTPDGLENVLKAARRLTHEELIVVYGCGGDRDRGKRPLMGSIAAEYSDIQIITSDNPRTEDPMKIIADILEGQPAPFLEETYLVEPDRRKAIERAVRMARWGDVLVIAGKGHEDYQIIGTEKVPFDDRKEVVQAIRLVLDI